ncbi:Acetyl-CoA acetyltransferase [compost metagenome]
MKEVVLIDGVRTPFGNFGGALKDLTAQELGRLVVAELLSRNYVTADQIEEVIMGCCGQASDATNIARVIALNAGLPKEVPGYTVHRNCGSGMQAIVNGFQNIQSGDADIQIVGGTESMSTYPFVSRDMRFGKRMRNSEMIDTLWEGLTDPVCNLLMGQTAENLVDEFGISREEQDQFAVNSHKKAFKAARSGLFKDELMTVNVPKRSAGKDVAPEPVSADEGPNPALSMQMLAMYPTIFKKGGTVTPGNACGTNDGAAALLTMSSDKASELGLKPLAIVRSYGTFGVEPERMGIAPAYAIPKALKKAGLTLDQMDIVEVNEAFAAQVLSVAKVLELDQEKLNPNGGAIALGHPVGTSGARLALTMAKELARRGTKYGVASLCIGGGQGIAMVLENPNA